MNLSLPKVLSIIHPHWFVVVELRLYVGLVPFEFLSLKAHVKSQVFCGGVGGLKGKCNESSGPHSKQREE